MIQGLKKFEGCSGRGKDLSIETFSKFRVLEKLAQTVIL